MNNILEPIHTYYSCEDLILDYIDKLNQGLAEQFSYYLKDVSANIKIENNQEDDNY